MKRVKRVIRYYVCNSIVGFRFLSFQKITRIISDHALHALHALTESRNESSAPEGGSPAQYEP